MSNLKWDDGTCLTPEERAKLDEVIARLPDCPEVLTRNVTAWENLGKGPFVRKPHDPKALLEALANIQMMKPTGDSENGSS